MKEPRVRASTKQTLRLLASACLIGVSLTMLVLFWTAANSGTYRVVLDVNAFGEAQADLALFLACLLLGLATFYIEARDIAKGRLA